MLSLVVTTVGSTYRLTDTKQPQDQLSCCATHAQLVKFGDAVPIVLYEDTLISNAIQQHYDRAGTIHLALL